MENHIFTGYQPSVVYNCPKKNKKKKQKKQINLTTTNLNEEKDLQKKKNCSKITAFYTAQILFFFFPLFYKIRQQ